MAKYKVIDRVAIGNCGRVNLSKVFDDLRGLQLEDKWNSKSDAYSENVQLRDVDDGKDHYLLAKRYSVNERYLILAKTSEGSFMVSQGVSADWAGRFAIKVTQKELEELFK